MDVLNEALAHATRGSHEAVEHVVRQMLALGEHGRNAALANIVHAALTPFNMMRCPLGPGMRQLTIPPAGVS